MAGGALAARLAALQILLVPVSAGFLAVGYYLAYWRKLGSLPQRLVLWLATPVTLFFWVFPYLTR